MEGQNVKAQTAVHLVDGTVVETDHSFEYMARLRARRGTPQSLTVVDGHGRVESGVRVDPGDHRREGAAWRAGRCP
jgi:hypothetical protein